jgi:hypothetical protein
MDADHERREIRAAMDRLLTGQTLRTAGALTIVGLAQEADVKRHVLTHRHTDLKDEFNARVRASTTSPRNWPPPTTRTRHYSVDWTQPSMTTACSVNRSMHSPVN